MLTRTTDEILRPTLEHSLTACGRGDTTAFADVYDALASRVFGVALRTLHDPHQAEEVAQEVLLQVWQESPRFDPSRGSARAWAMTLAHRRAVDRVRSASAVRRRDTAHVQEVVEPAHDTTAGAVVASIEAEMVRSALADLSPLQREVIELAYFGGHTHTEVSALLRIPLGTAKSRIRDGLRRLADALSPLIAEPA